MKKHVLVLSALIVMAFNSYSQFSFGLKGGININTISASGLPANATDYYKSNVGFHAGLFTQMKLSGKFSVSPELQFSRRGAAVKNPDLPAGTVLHLNYLELPVLVSYALIKRITVDLGPCFSYKVAATLKTTNSSSAANNLYNKNIDIGLAVGLKFHVTNKVSLIGRYYYGLTAIDQFVINDASGHTTTATDHNRTIQLGVSYKIK